jgi:hypothetical protein
MKKSNQQNKWSLLGFDSQEELYFARWCDEIGIKYEYKPTTFVLSDPVKLRQQKQRSICDVSLLNDATYTLDFVLLQYPSVIANIPTAVDIYQDPITQGLKSALFKACGADVWVDVKGVDFKSMGRTSDAQYPIKSKWLYQKHGVYVNSVVPSELFAKTFYPEEYFFSPTGKERTKKINNEFVGFGKLYKRIKDVL